MSRVRRIECRAVATVGPDFAYSASEPPPYNTTTIVRIIDDEGVEGYGGYDADSFGEFETGSLERLREVAPRLLGREVWARSGVAQIDAELNTQVDTDPGGPALPPGPLSALDIALWDIVATRAGLPLWQLLGGAESALPAYASLAYQAEPAVSLDVVAQAVAAGFVAIKLHVSGDPQTDIGLCEQVRAAHPGLAILLDAEGCYDLAGSRQVCSTLGAIGGRWLEAPLPDDDLAGYRELHTQSPVPILPAGEGVWSLPDFGAALGAGSPWDAIRTDVTYAGGITFGAQIAGIARAFTMDVELTSYGHSLVQAANLHAMLGFGGASYFEMAFPSEPWSIGVTNPLVLDGAGRVRAHDLPGLGVRWDQDVIDAATIAGFDCEDT